MGKGGEGARGKNKEALEADGRFAQQKVHQHAVPRRLKQALRRERRQQPEPRPMSAKPQQMVTS